MTTVSELQYPIFHPASRANPPAIYEKMRQENPIWMGLGPVSGNNFWFVTRYDDVVAVLKDTRFGKQIDKHLPPQLLKRYLPENPNPAFEAINRHLLNLDAPDHTRLRALVHKAFTPKAITDLKPRIETIAKELLDAMQQGNPQTDLIEAFAHSLPIIVIAEMLGVPPSDRDKFRYWTKVLLFTSSEEEAQYAIMEFVQYMNGMIEARQKDPQNDILSGLVHAEENGDTLDRMELLAMIFLLLVAGHETTVNLIGNGTLALMQHPDQQALLAREPQRIQTAVEEMLRFNGPVETTTTRWALEDVVINGITIPQGDVVLPSLLAANRDPKYFENPNIFDITRTPNPHIAFGFGMHYCLGAPLARLEGSIAINALLARFPKIAFNAEITSLVWNNSLLLHGVSALPVALQG